MALDCATTGYFTASTGAITLTIGTIVGWWKMAQAPSGHTGKDYFDTDTSRVAIGSAGNNAMQVYTDGRSSVFDITGLWAAGDWVHLAKVYNKTGDVQKLYVNGVEISPTSQSGTWGTTAHGTSFYMGSSVSGGGINGSVLAEWAAWSVVLDTTEVVALAKAFSPDQIRPASLNAYWKLLGNNSPELDSWKNSYSATLVNSPTKAAHPRIYYPG